jgi:hypothetical protein
MPAWMIDLRLTKFLVALLPLSSSEPETWPGAFGSWGRCPDISLKFLPAQQEDLVSVHIHVFGCNPISGQIVLAFLSRSFRKNCNANPYYETESRTAENSSLDLPGTFTWAELREN